MHGKKAQGELDKIRKSRRIDEQLPMWVVEKRLALAAGPGPSYQTMCYGRI